MSVEERYEYGYRITSGKGEGREIWEIDHGTDGTWTPWYADLGIPNVDIYDGVDVPAKIAAALTKANTTGIVLRRKVTVTTGPTEEVVVVS